MRNFCTTLSDGLRAREVFVPQARRVRLAPRSLR
jgi:hypothetical protein